MNKSDSQVPARKVERDEIVAAINEICEKRGVPAVRISDLEELDYIEVGTQSISENLDDLEEMGKVNLLEYGQKGVWWVPDDVESSTDIEAGVIDWARIEAEDIPHEVLADLPEFQDQTYWEGMADNWGTAAGGGIIVALLSLFVILVNRNTPVELGSAVSNVLLIILIGAVGVMLISIGIVQLAQLGQWLEDKGINSRVREILREAKHNVVRWIQKQLPDLEG